MLPIAIVAIAQGQGAQAHLTKADRLNAIAAGYRYLARQPKAKPGAFAIYIDDSEHLAFEQVQTKLANIGAPTIKPYGSKHANVVSLFLYVKDVVDRNHVVFDGSWQAPGSERMFNAYGTLVRSKRGWQVERLAIPAKDEMVIHKAALRYLLADREHGYSKQTAYVGIWDDNGPHSVGFGRASDPPVEIMRYVWSLGYSLKPLSEQPVGNVLQKPRHDRFVVGDIKAIDGTRTLVHIAENKYDPGGSYADVIGPDYGSEASLLVVKRNGAWSAKEIRGNWYSVPAE